MTKLHGISATALLAASFASSFAPRCSAQQSAESGIETIVVTATKTGQTRLQDTPIAISVISAQEFADAAGRDIRDLQLFSPSLTVAGQPYIRGIGSNTGFPGGDSSVAVYIDGVYISRPTSFFQDLVDVDQVEVLRGPQGTLYGRNATGGAISISTRQPSDVFTAEARLTAGNYDLWGAEGYVSGPVVADKVDVSVTGRYTWRDGYFPNAAIPGSRVDSQDDRATGSQIKFTPSDNLKILIRGDYSNSYSTYDTGNKIKTPTSYDPIATSTIGVPFEIAASTPPLDHQRETGISGEIDYSFSDAAKLTSLTAYRSSFTDYRVDSDFSAANVRYTSEQFHPHQTSEDLYLSGKIGHFSYITGFDYFEENVNSIVAVSTFPSTRTEYAPYTTDHAEAGYVQGTYDITSQFDVTAGVRYTSEHKTFAQLIGTETGVADAAYAPLAVGPFVTTPVQYTAARSYQAVTPKFGLDYRPVQDVLVYASVSNGFKSGGFSLTSANSFQGFNPEKIWDYELGAKTELDDHRVMLNLNGFHYNYSNLQVTSFIVPGVLDITNAATARVNGVEFETQVRPTESLTLGGAATYLNAKYLSYPQASGPAGIYSASGNYLNSAPKWALNLNAAYEHSISGDVSGFARLEAMYRARQYYTALNDLAESQGAYGTLNASAGIHLLDKHLEIEMFARNLANRQYYLIVSTLGGVTYGSLGAPRTFGVQVTAKY